MSLDSKPLRTILFSFLLIAPLHPAFANTQDQKARDWAGNHFTWAIALMDAFYGAATGADREDACKQQAPNLVLIDNTGVVSAKEYCEYLQREWNSNLPNTASTPAATTQPSVAATN